MTATLNSAVTVSPSSSVSQTTMTSVSLTFYDVDDYLESKNLQFVSSVAPTLSYVLFVMMLGLVGNSIVFFVYYRRFKASVTRTFILTMSVCDLMTNTLSLPADIVEVRFHNSFDYSWACKLFRTVKSFLSFWSACVLVAVAIDRQQAICNPRCKPTTVKHIGIILAVTALIAFLITIPYTVLTGRHTVHFEDTNITGSRCSVDDVYVKSRFLFIYNLTTGLLFLISITIMTVSYVRIARQLWLHKKNTTVTGRALGHHGASAQPTHTYIDEETSVDKAQLSVDALDQASSGAESYQKSSQLQDDKVKILCSNASLAPVEISDGTNCESAPREETDHMSGLAIPGTTTKVCNIVLTNTEETDHMSGLATPDTTTKVCNIVLTNTEETDHMSGLATPDTTTKMCNIVLTNTEETDHMSGLATPDTTTKVCNIVLTNTDNKPMEMENFTSTSMDQSLENTAVSDTSVDEDLTKLAVPKTSGHTSSRSKSILSGVRRTASDAKSFITGKMAATTKPRGSVRKIPTRTTFMMFVLTVIFIVNYLPYLVLVSVRARLGVEPLIQSVGLNGYHIGIRSYFINSAVNSLVYSFCSARFRQECRRLFRGR